MSMKKVIFTVIPVVLTLSAGAFIFFRKRYKKTQGYIGA
jgi:uncharacterized protein YxeA